MNDLEGYPSRSLVTATFFQLLVRILVVFYDFKSFFTLFLLFASLLFFFFEKLQPLYIEMAPKKTARSPKKRSSESSVLAPRAPPNPISRPQIPWGEPKNSQTATRGPQGAPLEPQRTTRDHRGTARELPRNPPGPQGPQESPCFFPRPSSLPLPCSCLPSSSSSLLPPFSRPSANFCQPLLANQSVHHPWGSPQGAGGTGRQPLR